MTAAHPTATRPTTAPHRGLYRRAARESGYLLLCLPLAVVGFVVLVATVSIGAPSLVAFLFGVLVLAVGLAAARALGDVERRRLAAAGYPLPPVRRFVRSGEGFLRWVVDRLKHGQGWLDLLFQVLNFPISLLSFVLTATWWATGVAATLYPLWEWALPEDGDQLADLLGIGLAEEYALYVVGGVLLLLTAPWVVRGLVWLHHGWARVTLGATSVTELEEQVASLTRSRAAVVGAEAETLRRIERDIHDGPQQRLVRVSMDLEAAQRRLAEGDAATTQRLVAESLEHVQLGLSELRTLSRGIAPPVLVDRGLRAAVVAVAGQCPIPVETDIALPPGARFAPARESAAYFVVTESLANAAKHSRASRVVVRITDDGVLRVVVSDDGVGGAHVGKGHGLAGLRDRLAGVDGTLEVHSPEGGGTVVTATIP